MKSYLDYVHTKKLSLNVKDIKRSCIEMNRIVHKNFAVTESGHGENTPISTKSYNNYNLLLYPFPGFHELYESIRQTFHSLNDNEQPHYIQCWLNFYEKGQFIDWHNHWSADKETWHGFYCVDVEPDSKTTYRLPDYPKDIDVPSEDNLLVISKSDGDMHRSSEWTHDRPRITIAFDIIPRQYVEHHLNHWIPI